MSAIIAIGPHRGGKLLSWDEDDGSVTEDRLPADGAVAYKLDRKLHFFFGIQAHETEAFVGRRTSITWYSVPGCWGVDAETKAAAADLGFRLPCSAADCGTPPFVMGYPGRYSEPKKPDE